MCHGISFLFALLSILVTSQQELLTPDHNYKDYNKPQPIDNFYKEDSTEIPRILNHDQEDEPRPAVLPIVPETTNRQLTSYEVTEDVEDVPDVNSTRGPIFTNYTISRPLNLAGGNRSDTVQTDLKDDGDEVLNSIVPQGVEESSDRTAETESEKGRSFIKHEDKETFIDHFHHRDTYYEDDDDEEADDEEDVNCEPKTDFGHNFHTVTRRLYDFLIGRFNHRDVKHVNRVKCPPFFRTLHKKGSILVNKLHNAILRHKLQHHHEEYDYY